MDICLVVFVEFGGGSQVLFVGDEQKSKEFFDSMYIFGSDSLELRCYKFNSNEYDIVKEK